VFFVRSEEIIPSPCCQGELRVIGSRRRKCRKGAEKSVTLIIRRLRCTRCKRIHHELPNLLVPYKRYEAASIEQVVTEPTSSCVVAEESTLRRWRSWFETWSTYAAGCLASLRSRFNLSVGDSSRPSQSSLHRLQGYVGDEVGWLARVVRSIANASLWAHTRSAFLS